MFYTFKQHMVFTNDKTYKYQFHSKGHLKKRIDVIYFIVVYNQISININPSIIVFSLIRKDY